MLIAFTSLLPIFALIALGFGLRKSNMIPAEQWHGIESIAYWLLFPSLLITTLARAELSFADLSSFALSLLLTVLIMCLIVWLLRKPLLSFWGVKGPAFTTIFQTSTRWHGFIALAIIDKLFGAEGVAILAIAFAVLVPPLNVINIFVLVTYAGKTKASIAMILKELLRNPLLWGIFLGILIKVLGIELPDTIFTILDLLGSAALGVSLLALGAGLSWRAMKTSGREVVFASIMRLLFTPALATILALAFGVEGIQFVIIVISASVPTAVNGYILARALGGDAPLYAATSTAQVIASFVTLPLITFLAMRFAL